MLSAEQRKEFNERGFLRIPGAFSRTEAAAMEDVVWEAVGNKYGACRTDPETWNLKYVSGLQYLRPHPAFQAIGGTVTREVINDLFGEGSWKKPKHWGQFLVSFPNKDHIWNVPIGWHTDFSFLASSTSLFGVMVFSFLADVAPRSGGTAVVAGSHRLVQRFIGTQPREILGNVRKSREAFMRSNPWLKSLASDGEMPDRIEQFMEAEHIIDGIPVQVCELTGESGDIILAHPWILHSGAPNCGNRPRFMLVQRIRLAGDLSESDNAE